MKPACRGATTLRPADFVNGPVMATTPRLPDFVSSHETCHGSAGPTGPVTEWARAVPRPGSRRACQWASGRRAEEGPRPLHGCSPAKPAGPAWVHHQIHGCKCSAGRCPPALRDCIPAPNPPTKGCDGRWTPRVGPARGDRRPPGVERRCLWDVRPPPSLPRGADRAGCGGCPSPAQSPCAKWRSPGTGHASPARSATRPACIAARRRPEAARGRGQGPFGAADIAAGAEDGAAWKRRLGREPEDS